MKSSKNQQAQQQYPRLIDLDWAAPYGGPASVSPEEAKMLLAEGNKGNRRPRRSAVEYLKFQISNGEWQSDHPQPIVFSTERLIDGQHRLMAIAESSVPVVVTVRMGVRDELREYMDTGKSRNLEDRLVFDEDYWRNRDIAQLVSSSFGLVAGFKPTTKPTPAQASEFFELHKEAILWVLPYKQKKGKGLTSAPACLAMMEMYERDKGKAMEFADSLFDPDGTIQPARRLRELLLRGLGIGSGRVERLETKQRCIAAMKAYLEGREIHSIRSCTW